ncbi:5'-nucleotidase C-terminal domain-containing protein [Flavobacterium sp. HXWNR69]|uniref:5'-nucleotidase C-terminal domain-containing protein n=1 Tax=Flavobacterium fragile TaxID=2949085 RepID=A0ABT0TH07_9FLAO|nr:5'-nucleotidase [Flavobacterium sp. HXWNR69]MCL9770118.1 5'-nucleotidase C-terminal domain-containing protein [Flavobacterium sp. HXWNR69]
MVNLKKKILSFGFFVILLTLNLTISCKSKPYYQTIKIEGKKIAITNEKGENEAVSNYVKPYNEKINNDLNSVLAYCEVTQDKSNGKWQTNIGNLLAQVTFEMGNPIFNKRENKNIDVCLLNHGGIRAIIPKGNVTTRTAFEVMPFENSLIVVGLTGKEIKDLAEFVIKEKRPHPLYGITIFINKENNEIKKIAINNSPVVEDKIYYVATSDYLANGGDNMSFFKDSKIKYDLDYKLRNILIDYFKKVDTIPNIETERIIPE